MPEEISTSEAAEVVGVSDQSIRDWCNEGLVRHRRVGRRAVYYVDRDDLIRYAQEIGYLPPAAEE